MRIYPELYYHLKITGPLCWSYKVQDLEELKEEIQSLLEKRLCSNEKLEVRRCYGYSSTLFLSVSAPNKTGIRIRNSNGNLRDTRKIQIFLKNLGFTHIFYRKEKK